MSDLGTTVGLIKALAPKPDPADIKQSVEDWLDDHPEATTTVEDGAITKAKLNANLQGTVDDVDALKSAIDSIEPTVESLDNTVNGYTVYNYTEGKNINSSGEIVDDADKCLSDFIPYPSSLTMDDYIRYYCNDNTDATYSVAFFDSTKTFLQRFQNPGNATSTFRAIKGSQVTGGTPKYIRFSFKKGTVGQVTNSKTDPDVFYWKSESETVEGIADKIDDISENALQTATLVGSDSVMSNAATLASGVTLSLDDAPWFIKKNVGISAVMKFDSFTSVTIGKGFEKYRGRWIVIDGTNVTAYYDNGSSVVSDTPVAHGLTISSYLQISMFIGADGVCRINLNSTSGTFQTTVNYLYEWNYEPFIFGGQAMTNVSLGFSCADLLNPLWIFGDSYMGIAVNRIAGQLKNAGFFNYCLNGVAGARSIDTGTPGKSSYNDLLRMLAISTPKYLIWADGMNGGDEMNVGFIPTLVSLCEEKHIELILYLTPSVPEYKHETLNTYIKSLNIRYVDGYDAVGANSSGEWYGNGTDADMLSSDGIHPSEIGAKALAMRFIVDAPEIMQYGYSTGSVDGEIDGDET